MEINSGMDVFDFISAKLKEGCPLVLATVVRSRGSSPADAGKKMALAADGRTAGTVGGGALEAEVVKETAAVLSEKKPRLLHFVLNDSDAAKLGMICGGEQEVFMDFITATPNLLIFGGGHVGAALARVAAAIEFPFSVVDDREEFVGRERFPRARKLVSMPYGDSWDGLGIDPDTYIVILTRGHSFDRVCLGQAVSTPARYIGMIGSRRKVEKIFSDLEAEGVQIRDDPRVYAPMGLALGDKSPEEIAISIMAEVIKIKSGKAGGHLKDVPGKAKPAG